MFDVEVFARASLPSRPTAFARGTCLVSVILCLAGSPPRASAQTIVHPHFRAAAATPFT